MFYLKRLYLIYLIIGLTFFNCINEISEKKLNSKWKFSKFDSNIHRNFNHNIHKLNNHNEKRRHSNLFTFRLTKKDLFLIIIINIIFFYLIFSDKHICLDNNMDMSLNINIETKLLTSPKKNCSEILNTSDIKFIDEEHRKTYLNHKSPPYIISYGGSGNTFLRLYIEYLTGFYTGSVYPSSGFLKDYHGFEGEGNVGSEVIAIKIHPINIDLNKFEQLLNGTPINIEKKILNTIPLEKNETAKVIYLIRNPWKATFALYNFKYFWHSKKRKEKISPHTSTILKRANSIKFQMRFFNDYFKLWASQVKFIHLHRKLSQNSNSKDFIIVKFEDLVNTDIKIKEQQIRRVLNFLINSDKLDTKKIIEKFLCFWEVGEDDFRMDSIHRKVSNEIKDKVLDINYLYNLFNDSIICKLWKSIEDEAIEFGYPIWRNITGGC